MATEPTQATNELFVRLGADDRYEGRLSDASLQHALSAMRHHGFVQIDDVLPPDFVTELQAAFFERYGGTSTGALGPGSMLVGQQRYMITIDVSGPFNDARIYANPVYFPLMMQLLGGEAVLDSFGIVCAYPGAPAQHVHVDHSPLFPESRLDEMLPCYAVTVVVPLVELDEAIGATAVWLGTHRERWTGSGTLYDPAAAYVPRTALGSVYLMDYRLVHGGRPNTTERPRPILYIVYARPWFTDSLNFERQAKIRMPAADWAAVPAEYRAIFAHASRNG